MKLLFISLCMAFSLFDIIVIIVKLANGTKQKARCIGFIPFSEMHPDNDNCFWGAIFEYEKGEKKHTTYTMNYKEYHQNKRYKLLVSDTNPNACCVIRTLNKTYVTDIIMLGIGTYMLLHSAS